MDRRTGDGLEDRASAGGGIEPFARRRYAGARLLSRFARNPRGVTAVEFGLLAPLLFVMIMGTIELGLMLAADMMLKNATYNAARTGRTGFVAEDSTRGATVNDIVKDRAGILMDPSRLRIDVTAYGRFDAIRKPEPFIDSNGNGRWDPGEPFTDVNGNGRWDADQGTAGYGGAQQIAVYTVTYPWTFITPLVGRMFSAEGTFDLTATAVVQNEPY